MLKPVVLRRTKGMTDVDGRAIVNLPPKTIVNVNVQLSDAELAFYNVRPLHRVSPYPCLTPLCALLPGLVHSIQARIRWLGRVWQCTEAHDSDLDTAAAAATDV